MCTRNVIPESAPRSRTSSAPAKKSDYGNVSANTTKKRSNAKAETATWHRTIRTTAPNINPGGRCRPPPRQPRNCSFPKANISQTAARYKARSNARPTDAPQLARSAPKVLKRRVNSRSWPHNGGANPLQSQEVQPGRSDRNVFYRSQRQRAADGQPAFKKRRIPPGRKRGSPEDANSRSWRQNWCNGCKVRKCSRRFRPKCGFTPPSKTRARPTVPLRPSPDANHRPQAARCDANQRGWFPVGLERFEINKHTAPQKVIQHRKTGADNARARRMRATKRKTDRRQTNWLCTLLIIGLFSWENTAAKADWAFGHNIAASAAYLSVGKGAAETHCRRDKDQRWPPRTPDATLISLFRNVAKSAIIHNGDYSRIRLRRRTTDIFVTTENEEVALPGNSDQW